MKVLGKGALSEVIEGITVLILGALSDISQRLAPTKITRHTICRAPI